MKKLIIIYLALLLTGCDLQDIDDDCISSHEELTMVPASVVQDDGSVKIEENWIPEQVCDQYAPQKKVTTK